jgi:prepilin-type N-terminal cleavage/methylation domain-containing protein
VNAQRRGEQGFTLIELTMVVATMGILFAIAVPSYVKFTASSRLAGARNSLMVDMRYARALASSQRRTYELRRSGTGYSLVCLSPSQTVISRILPKDVVFPAPDSTTFFAWGLTEPAAITLQQPGHSTIVRMSSGGQVSHD